MDFKFKSFVPPTYGSAPVCTGVEAPSGSAPNPAPGPHLPNSSAVPPNYQPRVIKARKPNTLDRYLLPPKRPASPAPHSLPHPPSQPGPASATPPSPRPRKQPRLATPGPEPPNSSQESAHVPSQHDFPPIYDQSAADAFQAELDERNDTIAKLTSERDGAEQVLANAHLEIAGLQADNINLVQRNEAQRSELNAVRAELAEASARAEKAEGKLGRVLERQRQRARVMYAEAMKALQGAGE